MAETKPTTEEIYKVNKLASDLYKQKCLEYMDNDNQYRSLFEKAPSTVEAVMSDVVERLRNMAEDYFKFQIDELPSDSLTRQVSESYIADIESAIAEIERLRSGWISVEEFQREPNEGWCWICHKGRVTEAYHDCDQIFRFHRHSRNCYMTESISKVMPILLPQPPQEPK